MEIERKFLPERLPEDLDSYPHSELEQGYLVSGGATVRIRRDGERFLLTIKKKPAGDVAKSKKYIANLEFEEEIPKDLYDRLMKYVDEGTVQKTRYRIPFGKYTVELDIFHGKLEGLAMAEIEFPTVEEASLQDLPDWFGREVTDDLRFRNSHLVLLTSVDALNVDKK